MKQGTWLLSITVVALLVLSGIGSLLSTGPSVDGTSDVPVGGALEPPLHWSDGFVDTDNVGVTRDVEVGGGQVVIATGESKGIVSSEAIDCPDGYYFDWLVVRAETTGNSSVTVALLNATETSQQVGYVNEPIQGYELRPALEQDLRDIDPVEYPSIRIQANLEVNGTHRPVLLNWTVAMVRNGEWRDDLIGTGKILQRSSVILSNDTTLSMDLGRQLRYAVHERDEYDKYPIIISNRYWHSNNLPLYIFYPNASCTGYGPGDMMGDESPRGFAVADLDEDGYDDLYVSNFQYDEVRNVTSYIMWGNESGRWSMARTTNLTNNGGGSDAVVGDFNGDGLLDLANLAWNDGFEKIYVYPNPGNRGFGPAPSIKLPSSSVLGLASGDLNGDGYDDLVAAEDWNSESSVYFGGPNGPDQVRDIVFRTGRGKDVEIHDLDGDGFLDVVFAGDDGGKTYIYMGGPGGPDTTPDFSLTLGDWPSGVGVGDMNDDGHLDLLFTRVTVVNPKMWFFPGSRSGWSDSTMKIITMDDGTRDVEVIDLDKDGIDDAVISGYNTKCRIHYGTTSGIKAAADEVLSAVGSETLCIGVPPKPLVDASSTIITHAIDRPANMKWDVAYVDAIVPDGTQVLIDVLDRSMHPVPGMVGIEACDVDLSGYSGDRLHLRIRLLSHDRVSTPTVRTLMVNWMEVDEWRDEFYGAAKTERLVGMDVVDGKMVIGPPAQVGDEIMIPSLRSDTNLRGTLSTFRSTGSGDYSSLTPVELEERAGHSAVAIRDVNNDNFNDAVMASYRTSEDNYSTRSPFYYSSSVGLEHTASHDFPTTGATDVVLYDLNGDGYTDVVFSQEQDGTSYDVNSTLFWGNSRGWNATPDVEFTTTGASAVIPAFIDDDDLVDLVFACYRAGTTTDIDSMVFVQEGAGFCGTVPSYYLGTKGAKDVAVGDLDGDGAADLVFANSFASGFVETDSFIYWGKSSGGFDPVPTGIETVGAHGVEIIDVDDDMDQDLVFANHIDDFNDRSVNSYIYLNDGTGKFSSTPDHELPTVGAVAVAAADLDNSGWLDLVFACQFDGSTYNTPSMVFLGEDSGWPSQPSYTLPTIGASDVTIRSVLRDDISGYISQAIRPRDPVETGAFEVLSYNISSGVNDNGAIMVVDADTWEVLYGRTLFRGSRSFVLRDEFSVREHPSVRILIEVRGNDAGRNLEIDDLRLNWSKRVKLPPTVGGITVSLNEVKRMDSIEVHINVSDEFDLPEDLKVTIESKLNTSTTWSRDLFGSLVFEDGLWATMFDPTSHTELGLYDLRARVEDQDFMVSGNMVFGGAIEVLNNVPSPPEISIEPLRPLTTDGISVTITRRGIDRENEGLSYRYSWSVDGEMRQDLVADLVDAGETLKGQNWSVEVRSYDGHDLSDTVSAWVVIGNSPPTRTSTIPPASIEEDSTSHHWFDLLDYFTDPDGDILLWALDPKPEHLTVVVANNGSVTIEPEPDWNGVEYITFVLTDGEFFVNATGLVTVRSVNDGPVIVAVNGIGVTGDVVELTGTQGIPVTINITVIDKEGDVLVYATNLSEVVLGDDPSNVSFIPDNDDVGVIRFYMSVKEEANPDLSDRIDFILTIENANDPMEKPVIEHPLNGSRFKVGESFWLNGSCFDPDLKHGQALHFKWTSDISGDLGVFSSVQVALDEVGNHTIMLRVDDGFTSKNTAVVIVIYLEEAPPPPPPPTTDEGSQLWMVFVIIVVAIIIVASVYMMGRTTGEAPEPVEDEISEEDRKREMLTEMAGIAGDAAEVIEKDRNY